MAGNRRLSRELALQVLFQAEFHKDRDLENEFNLYRNSFETSEDLWSYAKLLTRGILENHARIDQAIQEYSAHWKLERMSLVDRNILRIAVFELLFLEKDVPTSVVINEAIEVSKKFGSLDSGSFVNGILDQIAKTR